MENLTEKPHKDTSQTKKIFGLLMLEAGTEFAFLIAVPLIGFILLGRWLDNTYHHHFFVIIGIFAALIVSATGIWKRIKALQEVMRKKTDNN